MARRNRFEFLTRKFSKRMQKKLAMLFMAIMLAFTFFIGKITFISASNGDQYTKIVLDQQVYDSRVIPFKRGDIVDRNGTKLATSERVYHLILDVKVLLAKKDCIEPTIHILTERFGVEESEIRTALEEKADSNYVILKKGLTYEQSKEFEEITKNKEEYPDITGIWLEEDYSRKYPYNNLASSVIGFSGSSNVGAGGIEKAYNGILNGTDGREYGYLDGESAVEQTVKLAKSGKTVVSTIDVSLQGMVEECIQEFNQTYAGGVRPGEAGSKHIGVIIMNPNTGEILAMADSPNYDLNHPEELSGYYTEEQIQAMTAENKEMLLNTLWRNFCVSDTFEPGSTIKPFTVAAGLETGAILGEESYYCDGSLHVGDYNIHCHLRTGHGTQTVEDGVANSCNVAMMHIASAIGVENFVKYQHIFGFGEYTGIDLPAEAYTEEVVYTEDTMGITDLATNSFGQGFNVTMLQLATGFCSLVNGGNYYEPYVVKQILDENGNVLQNRESILLKKTISEETSEMVKQYMKAVVDRGTGTNVAIPGYEIGGKTGTAEKIPRGAGTYVLSFIGYAPQENPEVVVYVVIDEPNVGDQSQSRYVTELSRKIMEKAFPYLGITMIENYEPEDTAQTNSEDNYDYEDYDTDYEDDYANESGYYEDENYEPDYDDWADTDYIYDDEDYE